MSKKGTDLFDVLTTPGYVSMISGEPGVGKTTLSLMACAAHGRCTYISYADPSHAVEEKLKAVSPGFRGSFRAVNALSGRPEEAFSIIADAAERGELVVVDTVDAMLYEVKEGIRPLLQLIYGSVKEKRGSLILISEGSGGATSQLRFVADALVSVELEDVLGQPVRAVRLLKDRDRPIRHPVHYMTFSAMSLLEPYSLLKWSRIKELREARLSSMVEAEFRQKMGGSIVMELDESVTSMTARLYVEFFIAKYLKQGISVDWVTGPAEDRETIMEEVRALAGEDSERLGIIKVDPAGMGYSSETLFKLLTKDKGPDVISFINLMALEDFAVTSPIEFERLVNMLLRDATEKRRAMLVYGYEGLKATAIERKYVHEIRKLAVLNGFIFWRSIRPPGPLYFVRMSPSEGVMEFLEMT